MSGFVGDGIFAPVDLNLFQGLLNHRLDRLAVHFAVFQKLNALLQSNCTIFTSTSVQIVIVAPLSVVYNPFTYMLVRDFFRRNK